jgi:DNA-binding beta-propeller fold protein YncE
MSLRLEGYIDLPEHRGEGGFDHAAVHRGLRRLYVAHTANDALDVIDLDEGRHIRSIGGLPGIAGALVDEAADRVFTSNRGDDTMGILDAEGASAPVIVKVGTRPNGLAFDPARRAILVANVGDAADPRSHNLSVVDADRATLVASIPVAGRTRWTIHDPSVDWFFVNIADPPSIVAIDAADPSRIARTIHIPAAGPHGLAVDADGRLYCACDSGRLLVLTPPSYDVVTDVPLAGPPDVIFLDERLRHLYVAIGDPGLIEVFDIDRLERVDSVTTEAGAHTIGLDSDRQRVYAFLPASHRAAVFTDS